MRLRFEPVPERVLARRERRPPLACGTSPVWLEASFNCLGFPPLSAPDTCIVGRLRIYERGVSDELLLLRQIPRGRR